MTFGQQVRMFGALVVIASSFMHSILGNLIGLLVMAIGVTLQVDGLERRIAALEPKENEDETEA